MFVLRISSVRRDEIKYYFDKQAKNRDASFEINPILEYEQRQRQKIVLDLLAIRPGEEVLDLGCGDGRDMAVFERQGARCTGVDFSEEMIREGVKRLRKAGVSKARLIVGNAKNIPFKDEFFDKVSCSEVLEHIPDWEKAVREISRVVKRGGLVVITTPNKYSLYGLDKTFLKFVYRVLRRKWEHPYDEWKTQREVSEVLNQNGLKVQTKSTVCFIPGYFISYKLPRGLKGVLVKITAFVEPVFARILNRYGYTIGISAIKSPV